MERSKSKQIIVIVMVMIAVLGLAVGFAVFSANLTIKSGANVTPNPADFYLRFSSSETEYATGEVEPSDESLGENAIISSSDPTTISNLSATFTQPGESVSYTFWIRNDSKYDAYLTDIYFGKKTCQVAEETTNPPKENLMNAACADVDLILTTYDENGRQNDIISLNDANFANVNSLIQKGNINKVVVTLTYIADGDRADGDFEVDFGEIKFDYSTVGWEGQTAELHY